MREDIDGPEEAEELVVDLDELGEKYEDKGFFKRLKLMFDGFKKPKDSREYKIARIELQRLAAPLIAITSVTLFVIVLIVVTAISGETKKRENLTIAQVEPQQIDVQEEEQDPPDDPEVPEEVEIEVDVPNPGPVTEVTPVPSPPSQQVSVKPAPENTVAITDSPVMIKTMSSSRTPGSIGAATNGGAGWGDATTEACVLKVLWWLKATQTSVGSWHGGQNDLANTAFAVLTFLAHGEYPGAPSPYAKDFGPVVQRAVEFIIGRTHVNGANTRMAGVDKNEYAFLIATYALCEAYAMTNNPNIKEVAEACLMRIVAGQSPTGGWDYKMNPKSTRDDMSFGGWALQALKAGKMAGLHPDGLDTCIKKAVHCVKTRNFSGGGFNYTAGGKPTGLTATGCLALQLLGYGSDMCVRSALDYMREWTPTFKAAELSRTPKQKNGTCPQYYCYYATQCKYQAGMKQGATKSDTLNWQNWNGAMKKYYAKAIKDIPHEVKDWTGKGHKQGYYQNSDAHTTRPVMDSCLVALQLMVYYRYLPTTQTKAAEEIHDSGDAPVDSGDDVGVDVDI
ncbi:MAG: terpene cyclase/mutase family protein [Kiritimatiellae bacterium]|nr:terpene cyclase/mutase family protein [Kiritimatiellia bacterium]